MICTMKTRYLILALSACTFGANQLRAQATLNALNAPLVIDFLGEVPGVNNGPFDALTEAGAAPAGEGQLDLNAWDYFVDGGSTAAINTPSTFPGTLPAGNGFYEGGALATGLNATLLNGDRALGIQPTGGHFSAGNITLRVVNNTGGTLEQIAIAYTLGIFNDRDRSNSFTLYWSASNAQDSYQPVVGSAVVSPLETDAAPEWAISQISVVVNGFSVPNGGNFYLRWVGDDVEGAGQRDEFAMTNISLTAQALTGPVLVPSSTSLPAFSQTLGSPSAAASFTLSGSNLADEVSISVGAPFEVSLSESFGFGISVEVEPTAGTLSNLPLYVRLNNTVAGPSTGTVSITSVGALPAALALTGATTSGTLPVLYINELLASNATGITDPNGEFDDWIEIYNPSAQAVDLAGWYITDNLGQLTKYQFPLAGTEAIVPANGWLLIWADNQTAQGDLHTNFALSASGEAVVLVGPDGLSIVDQISFGAQLADVSYGRQTDGGTPWVEFTTPTPGASNNVTAITELAGVGRLRAWPVPAEGSALFLDRVVSATLFDMAGRSVQQVTRSNMVDIAVLNPGMYVLRADDGSIVRFTKQ